MCSSIPRWVRSPTRRSRATRAASPCPDLRGRLTRFAEIELAYTDRQGGRVVEEIRGLSAGTFQHEQDHLDGVLFVDRVEDPHTLTTWEGFRRWHEEAYAAEASALVARWGG